MGNVIFISAFANSLNKY